MNRTLSSNYGSLVEMVASMEQEGMVEPEELPSEGVATAWRLTEAGHEFVRENNIDLTGLDEAQVLIKVGLIHTKAELAAARAHAADLEAQAAAKRAELRNFKRAARG